MTRRVPLPTDDDIAAVIAKLTSESPGPPPAAVTVARELGMSNATFWRHFPKVAQELADTRRAARRSDQRSTSLGENEGLRTDLARLRAEKTRREGEILSAAAEIQRLTLENHALRTELEKSVGVIPLRVAPPA